MLNIFNQFPRWLRIGLIFPLAFLNGWLLFKILHYFEPLVSVFITATLLSFLLDVPIRILQQRGSSRNVAMGSVFLIAFLVLVLLSLILVPIIVQQLSELIANLPKLLETGDEQIQNLERWRMTQRFSTYIEDSISQITERLSGLIQSLSSQLLAFVLSTVGSALNIFLVFVLTIFLVIYGEQVWDGIFSWLPAPWDVQLRESIRQKFENYFTGQAILAGILSIAQTIVFSVLNVPYALLFGVTIGSAALIPFISSLVVILISILLMFQDIWLGIKVLVAAVIVGQINDNIIAPRLMGNIIGLNPVWIILSLFIGGKIAGFLGLLLAIPLASVIKNTVDSLRFTHLDKTSHKLVIEGTITGSLEDR